MTSRQKALAHYRQNSTIALQTLKNTEYSSLTDDQIWQILGYELEHYEMPHEVIFHELNPDEIIFHVQRFFKNSGKIFGDVSVDTLKVDPDKIEKANIKNDGTVWVVHRNDADPFPSSPHAHDYLERRKLHLGTGGLFRKALQFDSISPKELYEIRGKIEVQLPGLKLPELEV